ncbi:MULTISPECIES: hydroxymethylpyrimidine/phosphomethylpyrimidine kinase [unclassified Achromobacter]|uniref:bifunctional hydroxymethylpyrimidine kinase/phosphomethylpyrimidine kinase n=1 Tax=unclassified Achromobacter TaxID=2626865 RepID=UPI000B51A085|nr:MULTISPECIES: hydroxymethylpyrimidine/phosphomethylpyrimidine kinase [unclassified Achromobacter]OWT75609.1 hydroxymethylpyrimidine/phosphomethylpyrimidine kinase [Achromobacter sp. HZ28]OWT76270.1 hydroxymethylpyrimidine/phosphomethylpyrimidine kinase [Achromobacter sp. HZ34]
MTAATPPIVLIFGPADPTGSDGLPADAVTCARMGCHGLAAITAITVQDTAVMEEVHSISPELLDDQARCLLEDMPVQAIKVGGLYSAECASAVAQIAADYSQVPLVLHLGHRSPLPADAAAQDDADDLLAATLELVLPQADVVVVEHARLAQWLSDGTLEIGEATSAAHAMVGAGAKWVLALGAPLRPGHAVNLLVGPEGTTTNWPWQPPPDRSSDSGGLLATTLAACLAQGMEVPEAVEKSLPLADAAVAASFLPGMGRRIANRMLP